jgi:hypothetical protein
MLYLYTNMEELDPYFEMFDSIYLASHKCTPKELDNLCLHIRLAI